MALAGHAHLGEMKDQIEGWSLKPQRTDPGGSRLLAKALHSFAAEKRNDLKIEPHHVLLGQISLQ